MVDAINILPYTGGKIENKKVKRIIVKNVTNISIQAFWNCTNLVRVDVEEYVNLQHISNGAFWGCSSLDEIRIPPTVLSIGCNAFRDCSSLKVVHIPPLSVAKIGRSAFQGCSSLEMINLPQSIKLIDLNCFYGCSSLKVVNIPQSVSKICLGAFAGCTLLETIRIPELSINIDIGLFAFLYCSSLSTIEVPKMAIVHHTSFDKCKVLDKLSGGNSSIKTHSISNWLMRRFEHLPLHRICYQSTVTPEKIRSCLLRDSRGFLLLHQTDQAGLTPLHLLTMMNNDKEVTKELFGALLKKPATVDADGHSIYLKSILEAKDMNGMTPIEYACNNENQKQFTNTTKILILSLLDTGDPSLPLLWPFIISHLNLTGIYFLLKQEISWAEAVVASEGKRKA